MACDCGGRGGERRPVECGRRVPLSRLSTQQGHVAVLDDALLLVKEADETIEKLDEVVKNPFADGSDEQRVDIQAQFEDVEGKLQDADEKRALSRWS